MAAAVSAAGGGGGRDEEEKVSLGLIMTNTEIFHIFHINSLFNLPFFHIFHIFSLCNLLFFHIFHIISHFIHIFHIISQFSSVFSKSFLYSIYLSFIISISFHYLDSNKITDISPQAFEDLSALTTL